MGDVSSVKCTKSKWVSFKIYFFIYFRVHWVETWVQSPGTNLKLLHIYIYIHDASIFSLVHLTNIIVFTKIQ
jgi:hypothetical protein